MSESIHSFELGPYRLLEYETIMKDGKAYIELNQGDLGRLPIEDLQTVEKLREALDKVELEMKESERRKEEL